MDDKPMRRVTVNMKAVDVKIGSLSPIRPFGSMTAGMMKTIWSRTVEEFDLRMRADGGDLDAMLELSRRAEVAANEKAERKAFREERRRWKNAYQWAKWGE